MKIAVITHALHSKQKYKLFAYAPYVREMDYWFAAFENVRVIAPAISKAKNSLPLAYKKQRIELREVPAFSLLTFFSVLKTFFLLPLIFYRVFRAMQWADHIHLRCPGNMGLIGCIVQSFFPKKFKTVKYAGNWDPKAKQPFSYKLQKKILSNTFLSRNIKVLVYGEWPGQSKNIVPFFTASFSEIEKSVFEKEFKRPFKFLFVGSLVEGKRPMWAIQLVEKLITKKIPVKLEIYGNGTLRKDLEEYVAIKNLEPFVIFFGNRKLEDIKEAYKKSHFLVLASKSEGWPKAVAEAMFYGCIPITTPVSCVPWMLSYGERGILIHIAKKSKKNNEKGFDGFEKNISIIINSLRNPEKLKKMSLAGQKWSQNYTLKRFKNEISAILDKQAQNAKLKTETEQPPGHNTRLQTRNHRALRVLQLIDSLRPGGAERLTVNLANALTDSVGFSAVCTTRIEGDFKKDLKKEVSYVFLNKKSSFDFGAIFRLRKYIVTNKIKVLHTHGTSFFMGCIQKIMNLKLKLIWHDHYGNRPENQNYNALLLKICSLFFDGIICVNKDLFTWSKRKLFTKKLRYISNFVSLKYLSRELKPIVNKEFTIVQLANLKSPKNHLVSLRAFKIVVENLPDCKLILVGKDYNDDYSEEIKKYIKQENLQDNVRLTDLQIELKPYLKDAHLGVLSSDSEGLPISLLEYGLAGITVVCTNVGDCKKVVGEYGKIVPRNNPQAMAAAILSYFCNSKLMLTDADKFQQKIIQNYSEKVVLSRFLDFYNEILPNA